MPACIKLTVMEEGLSASGKPSTVLDTSSVYVVCPGASSVPLVAAVVAAAGINASTIISASMIANSFFIFFPFSFYFL
ncbi:MAG: hypothetical protein MR918_07350 [Clostridiales bacterium]|nr:hypothetical protein [Clostridiales bacterium]